MMDELEAFLLIAFLFGVICRPFLLRMLMMERQTPPFQPCSVSTEVLAGYRRRLKAAAAK